MWRSETIQDSETKAFLCKEGHLKLTRLMAKDSKHQQVIKELLMAAILLLGRWLDITEETRQLAILVLLAKFRQTQVQPEVARKLQQQTLDFKDSEAGSYAASLD